MEDEAVIREQMNDTRVALTEKLETLEQKVAQTVEGAASAVSDTVENIKETVTTVKETVEGTVSTVKESVEEGIDTVKDWLDLGLQTRRHPWLVTGGAVLTGYLLGRFFQSATEEAPMEPSPHPEPARLGNGHKAHLTASAKRPAPAEPASWLSKFEPEFQQVKSLALGALLGTAREMIVKAVPEHLGAKIGEVIDQFTAKVGGESLPDSDLTFATEKAVPPERQRAERGTREHGSRPRDPHLGQFDRR